MRARVGSCRKPLETRSGMKTRGNHDDASCWERRVDHRGRVEDRKPVVGIVESHEENQRTAVRKDRGCKPCANITRGRSVACGKPRRAAPPHLSDSPGGLKHGGGTARRGRGGPAAAARGPHAAARRPGLACQGPPSQGSEAGPGPPGSARKTGKKRHAWIL